MFNFAKRIFLLLATNILIITTISIVLNILGVKPYLTSSGIDYNSLLIFCLIWGFAGSFISLLLSRFMAKWMMGVKVIDPQNAGQNQGLVNIVHDIAKRAQLPAMPQVGVYDSPELNAFATGPSARFSLVAVSSGLLSQMSRDEIEGVLAHEVAHIKNGDMITMTLLQGLINAFVMFFARVIAFAVSQNAKEESRPMINMIVTFVLEIAFSMLGMIIVMWFSRQREFRADSGAASLVGSNKMVAALKRLQLTLERHPVEEAHPSLATMKISGGKNNWFHLFLSHPPLERRIDALMKREYATR